MASDIGTALFAATRAYRSAVEQRFPPGLTSLQAAVLNALASDVPSSGRALARALSETAQTTHDALTALERKGLIARRVSDANARVRESKLTETGHDALTSVRRAMRATERIALGNVTSDEVRHLSGILKRMQVALEAPLALATKTKARRSVSSFETDA